ncbi:MAG: hypothetical protein AVO35_04765 [Candidatus Aegiribacteria sp. MLS_C]|nr:MAG: hypothetical protein AVO35_04765 [Candidatus Aegiribacteria sp. MLS_C]
MDEALFGRIRRELLSVFLFNPSTSFYLLELVSLLRTGRGGVQRELGNLVSAGLVSRRREGVRVLFSLAEDCPAAGELEALLRAVTDTGAALEVVLRDHRRSIQVAVVDGSAAETRHGKTRLMIVAEDVPDSLQEDLERLEIMTGTSLETVLMKPESVKGITGSIPETDWVLAPAAVYILGSPEDMMPTEPAGKELDGEPDLFSGLGLDW